MDALLHAFGVIILFIACLLAMASLVFGLPGTFFIVGIALLYAWATGFAVLQWSTIGWLVVLAVSGEVVELLLAGGAVAEERPSLRVTAGALIGALVGGILGTPILFGIGSLLGALAGAFAGAALAVRLQGGSLRASLATGLAALKGRLLGLSAKAAIAAVMLIVIGAIVL